jgi:hypothetical protein
MMTTRLALVMLLPALLTCGPAGAEPANAKPASVATAVVAKPVATTRLKDVTPMVTIPAGTYVRCQNCGAKKHVEVTTSAFRIDQDEVTQAQYAECVAVKRCRAPAVKLKHPEPDEPVRGVSWADAAAYVETVRADFPHTACGRALGRAVLGGLRILHGAAPLRRELLTARGGGGGRKLRSAGVSGLGSADVHVGARNDCEIEIGQSSNRFLAHDEPDYSFHFERISHCACTSQVPEPLVISATSIARHPRQTLALRRRPPRSEAR